MFHSWPILLATQFLSFLWDSAFYAKTIGGIEDDVKGDALILQNGLLLNHKFWQLSTEGIFTQANMEFLFILGANQITS